MTKVIIADDHALVREGIRAVLEKMSDIEVIAEFQDGTSLLTYLNVHQPDILILDISIPGVNGVEVSRHIAQFYQDIKVIMVSMYSDENYIIKCLENGVKGYLLKGEDISRIRQAIKVIQNGGSFFSEKVKDISLQFHTNRSRMSNFEKLFSELTSREKEIAVLVIEGFTSQEVSEKLHISPRTVDTHRSNLMKKLCVKNILDLIKKANKSDFLSKYSQD